MSPLILDIPTIAITGSSGKTTTREMIASILRVRWKVLKNKGNKNLPYQIKELLLNFNSSYQAVVLELGLGKLGACQKDCRLIQPNISIITNIGSAHYGNLGNSIKSTANAKSVLIKNMKPNGTLFLNNDDANSKLLKTKDFQGEIVTIGIENTADYSASDIEYLPNGVGFRVMLDNSDEVFFVPAFGSHTVINALFAIALCHRLQFTSSEIRQGLEKYKVPIKRLNVWELAGGSLLVDDTVSSNPQAVKAAVDVMVQLGKGKKKIAVLGSMLELGEYSTQGHQEVGRYLAEKEIDEVITFGQEAKGIGSGAVEAGLPQDKVKHFQYRENLHYALKNCLTKNSIVLVKGSSATQMDETARFVKKRYMFGITVNDKIEEQAIRVNDQTLAKMKSPQGITLHFGALTKVIPIEIDNKLETGKIVIPQKLTPKVTIPDLPYDYYLTGSHLFLGPVIGLLIYPRYFKDPQQQILRFSQYDKIKGLVFLFKATTIRRAIRRIEGHYYNPITNSFVFGTFPYPNVIFNRIPLNKLRYKHFRGLIGEKIFNYPYLNVDKWNFWVQMSRQPEIKEHLPKTKLYSGLKNLLEFLETNKTAYLKPTTMAGGTGILRVAKKGKGYNISDRFGTSLTKQSVSGLSQALTKQFAPKRPYIIQQEILSFNHFGNKIDFRAYIQKDHTKRWKFSGLETKLARAGSIISNSKNRERIVPGEQALQEFFNLNESEAAAKIKEITRLCIRTLQKVEETWGHLADAAVDLIIDKDLKIWLLEVQINYAAELKARRKEDEQQVLPAILPTPLEYAKALTDF